MALQLLEADGGSPVPIVSENGDKLFFANFERFDLPPQLVDAGFDALAIDEIASQKASVNLSPEREDIPIIRSHAIRIPYLRFKETDYIYRFRTEKQRILGFTILIKAPKLSQRTLRGYQGS